MILPHCTQYFLKFAPATHKAALDSGIIEAVNKWKEVIHSRAEACDTPEDDEIAREYTYYCRKIEERTEECGQFFMLLKDSSERIQALAALTEESRSLHVDILLSAAWNVPMSVSAKVKAVKGAGTTLMRQIYEYATLRQKQQITLDPVPTAASFYRDHLKMSYDRKDNIFFFTVQKASIPKTLDVPSGNLLAKTRAKI